MNDERKRSPVDEPFRLLVESVSDYAIFMLDPTGRIKTWNRGAQRIKGYSAEEIIGEHFSRFYTAADIERDHPADELTIAARDGRFEEEGWRVRKGGGRFWANVVITALFDERGRLYGFGKVTRDLSERESSRQALSASEERFRLFVESVTDYAIFMLDPRGYVTSWNRGAERINGYRSDEIIGEHFSRFFVEEDVERGHPGTELAVAAREGSYEEERWRVRKGGERFFANVVLTALFDERGILRGFGKVIRDITDRRENEARLVYLADHDPLTGLVNRRRFEQDVDDRLVVARRAGLPLSVLFIDLDNFKYVNDTFGHQAGDQLIRLAGGAITRCLRDADVLARLGGDEFGVLLGPGAGADAGLRTADRIRAALSREDLLGVADRPVRLTASVGVATVSEGEGLIATEALTRADIAMYEAKAAGRDTSIVYTPSGRTRMQAAQGMVGRLRHTLEHNLLTLHAQPIIAVATGDVTGYELLVRMPAEDGSLLAAGAFIPIAERFGMVGEIDRWVVTSAILLAAELQSANPTQSLAVNLSGGSIGDPELLELITAELAHTGVDPARLTFEITETAAIANMDDAVEFARRLTRLGCRFALDDFGAGFGSYYYLKHLPVDTVKIDGEFVRSLASSPTDRVLVKAMVDVAHGLERTATAEFVENEDTMHLLRDFGVDHAQGYHLGRPAPVADVLAAIESARRGATSGDMP